MQIMPYTAGVGVPNRIMNQVNPSVAQPALPLRSSQTPSPQVQFGNEYSLRIIGWGLGIAALIVAGLSTAIGSKLFSDRVTACEGNAAVVEKEIKASLPSGFTVSGCLNGEDPVITTTSTGHKDEQSSLLGQTPDLRYH